MSRLTPLPEDLPDAFRVAEAAALGVGGSRLRRADLTAPFHGVRSRALAPAATLLSRCLAYAPRLSADQFFSHETALGLNDAPLPDWPHVPGIHVSTHRPLREPRTAGVIGHRLQARASAAVIGAHGLPVEDPVRAWRQAGTLWKLDDLIAAADALIAAGTVTADDLREEIELMGDLRKGILRRALAEVRGGVRSPRETKLRLVLGRAGLPEPEVNWTLRDPAGRFVAELDLAYPRWRVAAEYDGRVHADDARQFAKDADRWDRIRSAGWDLQRCLNHHFKGAQPAAVTKVRDALLRAGWRPGL